MFASMSVGAAAVDLTLKLTAEEREIAQLLPYVRRAKYVGRYGWVTAEVTDEESLDAALEWLRESYWLKAPAHLRDAAFARGLTGQVRALHGHVRRSDARTRPRTGLVGPGLVVVPVVCPAGAQYPQRP